MMGYTLKTNLANRGNYGSKRSVFDIKYIVIHYTANDGDTDENNGNYFKNNRVDASAHYFVDDDSVTQSVPDDYVAWSVGGSKYASCASTGGGTFYGKCANANSLNIEICDDVKNGVIYPSAQTIANALELTKKLMAKYNVPASNVIRHFDVTGKICPGYWSGTAANSAKWKSEFWNKLANGTTATKPTASSFKPYLVKKNCDVLNIRSGPGTNYKVVGQINNSNNYKYTIIEEKVGKGSDKGWGKLKSGAGWIALDWVKKV
jgi:N-acetylmuramoyl-L-alanine amidase CwlA